MASEKWFVYIVKCSDGSLYTGVTTDLERRIDEHNKGTGSKYTRVRTPVKLLYTEEVRSRSRAQEREAMIKSLSRQEKLKLIQN